jgi:hypothetical protein
MFFIALEAGKCKGFSTVQIYFLCAEGRLGLSFDELSVP